MQQWSLVFFSPSQGRTPWVSNYCYHWLNQTANQLAVGTDIVKMHK